ncbi:hypothetical protein LCGC14_1112500 [marine sediment metagenome]|uniref:Uncharacterized protein n=1 Tax=marine sediment metagenome TaxID=412755 RepID=A0A0F9QCE6_9ZZZZ
MDDIPGIPSAPDALLLRLKTGLTWEDMGNVNQIYVRCVRAEHVIIRLELIIRELKKEISDA